MSNSTIYLVSNAHLGRLPQNTLSDFESIFESDLTLRYDQTYSIALDEIGIDDASAVDFIPDNDYLAPMICTKMDIPSDGFYSNEAYENTPMSHKIFLPRKHYYDWVDVTKAITVSQDAVLHDWSYVEPFLWSAQIDWAKIGLK